ncbi:hypothetical protein LCGC14_0306430 [marine sediment metagenome]|uniref:VCBS repeat-containing protein n=1 Tax=marine sediment metagenome TaxID=412755 RepID=A0A0F9TNJ1_9ZZZZ
MNAFIKCFLFYTALIFMSFVSAANNSLSEVEVHIDNLGVEGTGLAIAHEGEINVNAIVTRLDISYLTDGVHTIYIRVKDEQGIWSSALGQNIVVKNSQLNGESNTLVEARMKINGTFFDHFTTSKLDNIFADSIELATKSWHLLYGKNTITVSIKDKAGNWSSEISQVYVLKEGSDVSLTRLADAEYFFDADPGLGKATSFEGPFSFFIQDITSTPDVNLLSPGLHKVGFRTLDENNVWSNTYIQVFELFDFDGDGVNDLADLDDDNDGLSDITEEQIGTNPLASDSDGDGVIDGADAFPLNIYESIDTDNDGIGNNADLDDDGDGVNDDVDAFPLDASESIDTDNDGIGNNKDLDDDNDGISDEDEIKFGLDPLDSSDANLAPLNLMYFSDASGDGVDDWLKYSLVDNVANIYILDGQDFSEFSLFNISYELDNPSIELLGDRNNDGIKEIGLFGFNADVGRYQLAVYNGYTGQGMGTWNWVNTLSDVEFKLLDDLTLDGVQEYAITGIHLTNGTKQLFVKNGATKQTYKTFKWPNQWLDSQIVIMSDVTSDGIPEVALYGRHERLDKGQLFVYDGANSNSKLDVYNWNKLWSDISLHKMDDLDGDGTTDWGQFGQRKDDGRYQWVVKKGHDKRGVIRTFSWPNDLTDVEPLLLSDTTGDSVSEVALYGKDSNGKVFLRVNDGRLANTRIANFSWPAVWADEQVMELGDLNNDGFNEVALLGINKNSGKYQLVIKDGQATTEYGRLTLEGNWADLVIRSYDVNNDGQADVIVNGVNAISLARTTSIYSGSSLGLLSTATH